jgi:hypothetical protein
VGRAIVFGSVVVVTYAVIHWTSSGLYWGEFALLVAVVVGIGAIAAHASGERPFVTAAVVAFMTVLCIESLALTTGPAWARPEVLPPPTTMILAIVTISLMTGAITGVVALGLRSLRSRLRPRR